MRKTTPTLDPNLQLQLMVDGPHGFPQVNAAPLVEQDCRLSPENAPDLLLQRVERIVKDQQRRRCTALVPPVLSTVRCPPGQTGALAPSPVGEGNRSGQGRWSQNQRMEEILVLPSSPADHVTLMDVQCGEPGHPALNSVGEGRESEVEPVEASL